MLLITLVFICGAVLLISAAMTYFVSRTYKHQLLETLLYFWLSGILSFVAQGVFSKLDTLGFLAFSLNWITVILALKIFASAIKFELPYRKYNILFFASVVVAVALQVADFSYQTSALIFCLTAAGILIHGSTRQYNLPNNDKLSHGFRAILLLSAIHFLDYPFLRPNPELAVVGFGISLVFFFCFSIYVPIFILRIISMDYTKKLESEVIHRTLELNETNDHLKDAIAKLRTSKIHIEHLLNENRSRLSVLVHDISTPLQTVFLNLSLLIEDPSKFVQKLPSKTEGLQQSIDAATEILREARTTHAMMLGKSSVKLNTVKLSKVIAEILKTFDDKIKNKNLIVEFDKLLLEKIFVMGNESWLRNQVFSNILSNAIKFSQQGGVIKVHAAPAADNKISVYISDDGVGIPSEMKSRIFDLYEKTTTAGTIGEEGTGFGLPIVKLYTEMMGVEVQLVEKSTQGTCVEIRLTKGAA